MSFSVYQSTTVTIDFTITDLAGNAVLPTSYSIWARHPRTRTVLELAGRIESGRLEADALLELPGAWDIGIDVDAPLHVSNKISGTVLALPPQGP